MYRRINEPLENLNSCESGFELENIERLYKYVPICAENCFTHNICDSTNQKTTYIYIFRKMFYKNSTLSVYRIQLCALNSKGFFKDIHIVIVSQWHLSMAYELYYDEKIWQDHCITCEYINM